MIGVFAYLKAQLLEEPAKERIDLDAVASASALHNLIVRTLQAELVRERVLVETSNVSLTTLPVQIYRNNQVTRFMQILSGNTICFNANAN